MGALSKLSVLYFTVLSCIVLYGQEEVPWRSDLKLNWNHFKGEVPMGSGAAATTASGISYRFSTFYENGKMKLEYSVYAFFYPTESWYKPKICNDVTLSHERLHFDISELFARKMDEEMAKTSFTKNVKQEVRAIYKKTLRELNMFQNEYDIETNYSRNVPQQKHWIAKIQRALSSD
ncbi:DUF922 domain-containing protein [Maribacter sp. CXY002]|uniref:DUF922 domain-containing protein n=1 Tax=Maribacter luteocoastalis TaxID=3407671 RepID=UPI003B683449